MMYGLHIQAMRMCELHGCPDQILGLFILACWALLAFLFIRSIDNRIIADQEELKRIYG